MHVYNYASFLVCKYAILQEYMYEIMQVFMYESKYLRNYACIQVCNCVSMKLFNNAYIQVS